MQRAQHASAHFVTSFANRRFMRIGALMALCATGAGAALAQSNVQDDLLRPGEAYVTRFSGTATSQGSNGQPITVIDTGGTVGSIIDVRSPSRRISNRRS